MYESSKVNEIAKLLMSARADIVVNKNFVAAAEAISIALDEIAKLNHELTPMSTNDKE